MEFSLQTVLIFATVTAALAACGYITAGLFGREASRVRERVESEFGRAPLCLGTSASCPLHPPNRAKWLLERASAV